MKFAEYIPLAYRTCKELPPQQHAEHMAMGILGELGEIVDAVKKHYVYGRPLDKVNLMEEVGDIFWYLAGLVHVFGKPDDLDFAEFEQVEINQEKLQAARDVMQFSLITLCKPIAVCTADLVSTVMDGNENELKDCIGVITAILHGTTRLLDVDLDEALERNIAQLAKRYGDKYTDYAAVNRDTGAERSVLEGN